MKRSIAVAWVIPFLFLGRLLVAAEPSKPPSAGSGPTAPPTTQAIQEMLDQKQYNDVVKEAQRALRLKGDAAKGIDKYDILMLRAEAQLQLKQQSAAVQSYQEAMKSTSESTKAGIAKAMVSLLQKSHGFKYTPKGDDPKNPPEAIDILDPEQRKTALLALFDEQWKPAQAKIEALKKKGDSLPPIIEAAGLAGEMRGLEIAATGSDKETGTALSDLTGNAAKLMTDYLDAQTKKVDEIDRLANMSVSETTSQITRRGLTGSQMTVLKDTIANAEKLALAAQQIASSAGATSSQFKTIADKSTELSKRATEILNADYTTSYDPNSHPGSTQGRQKPPNQPNQPNQPKKPGY